MPIFMRWLIRCSPPQHGCILRVELDKRTDDLYTIRMSELDCLRWEK